MRALRTLSMAVGGVLALLILGLLALPLCVDPNAYKGRVERIVKQSTGRELALSGRIRLSVFPWIALELGPASLSNPPGFGPGSFATLKHAALQLRLLPLLHKQLRFRRIEIDGLDLHLTRNARQQGNWEFAATAAGPNARAPQRGPPGMTGAPPLPTISGLAIRDGRVSYQDLLAERVNIKVGPMGPERPIPVDVHLVLTPSPQARPLEIASRFDLAVSASTGVRIENLEARVDGSTVRGHAALTDLTRSAMSFDLTLDQIDLDRYLAQPGAVRSVPSAALPEANDAPSEQLPVDRLRGLRLDGLLAMGRARIEGILLSDVRVGISARDGITRIAPITAALYGGEYSGEITLDVRAPIPVIVLDQSMTGIDVAGLLGDFAHTQRLAGRGNLTSHLIARGATRDAMLRSLSGHTALSLADGAIEGIDFRREIHQAMALVGMRNLGERPSDAARTRFDTFAMSADLTDGIAVTRDLHLASRRLSLTGGGTADLAADALDYKVIAALAGAAPPDATQAPGALVAIPFDITGTLESPRVRPDLRAMARSIPIERLERQENVLQQKLLDKLKGLFR